MATTAADSAAIMPSSTRYVWANNLILRAKADGKSDQLAKIPYGATVVLGATTDAPVQHTETIAKFTSEGKTTAVTIDGAWQKVHWQDKDGWIFDGFVSRYPAPERAAAGNASNMDSDPVLYAIKQFGNGPAFSWKAGQSIKSRAFTEMVKSMHETGYDADLEHVEEWEWREQNFGSGASFMSYSGYNGGGSRGEYFTNLKLTFNEAVLWAQHFYDITKFDIKGQNGPPTNSVDIEPGKRLTVQATDGNSESTTSVECTATACIIANHGGD